MDSQDDASAFVRRAQYNERHKEPVRTAVREYWEEIRAAKAAGLSFGAIRNQLMEDGVYVGKSRSGFINAVRFVEREKAGLSAPTRSTEPRLGDHRFKSEY